MKYIIVVTEYFTKWTKAKVIKINDVKGTTILLYDNVITRFNRSKTLNNDKKLTFFEWGHQEHGQPFPNQPLQTTSYYPQTNGQTQ